MVGYDGDEEMDEGFGVIGGTGCEELSKGENGDFSLIFGLNPPPYLTLQLTAILAELSQSQ